MNDRISHKYKLLIAILAFIIFINLVHIQLTFASETDKSQFFVGKYTAYKFTQGVENENYSNKGTITYRIISYDPTASEYTINIELNLILVTGKPYSENQTVTRNYKNPFETVTDTMFIDKLVPGDSSLATSDGGSSTIVIDGKTHQTRIEDQTITKSYELTSSEESANKYKAVLESKINGILTYFKESRIPYSVEWKLDKAEFVGVSDEDLRNKILEDYGGLVDFYKNTKFNTSLVLTDTNIDLNEAEQFFTGYYAASDNKGGGCLIATATFGSELAPQVQFLREIRDNTVLSTQSGTSFMTAFNAFYYSFSPTVADWERQNPVFKEMVKITITPLLSSLSLLQYVDINSDTEMLGYGIGIILLNIGMYFVAPTFLIVKLKRRFSKIYA